VGGILVEKSGPEVSRDAGLTPVFADFFRPFCGASTIPDQILGQRVWFGMVEAPQNGGHKVSGGRACRGVPLRYRFPDEGD